MALDVVAYENISFFELLKGFCNLSGSVAPVFLGVHVSDGDTVDYGAGGYEAATLGIKQ
jgi:hypothetical protein